MYACWLLRVLLSVIKLVFLLTNAISALLNNLCLLYLKAIVDIHCSLVTHRRPAQVIAHVIVFHGAMKY